MAGQLGANNPSLAAVRTEGKIFTGERPQHVLPGVGLARVSCFRFGGSAMAPGAWRLRRARACSSLVLALAGAMRPKCRILTNRGGRTCPRKRRMNSRAGMVTRPWGPGRRFALAPEEA